METNIPLWYRIPNGIISSDILLGRVLSIYLYSIAYSIANSVGYFIHTALGDVLTKLPKADSPKFLSNFFAAGVPSVGDTQIVCPRSPINS